MDESSVAINKQPEKNDKLKITFMQGIVSEGVMLILAVAFIFGRSVSPSYFGQLSAFESLIYGTVGGVILYIALALPYSLSNSFIDDLRYHCDQLKYSFDQMPLWQLACIALSAGIAEEFLFREVLQTWLVGELSVVRGIALASLAFGLAHFISIPYVTLTMLMGVLLGWLYHVTGSLVLVMTIHAVYDFIALYVIKYKPELIKIYR